jgi:hypothetical protein
MCNRSGTKARQVQTSWKDMNFSVVKGRPPLLYQTRPFFHTRFIFMTASESVLKDHQSFVVGDVDHLIATHDHHGRACEVCDQPSSFGAGLLFDPIWLGFKVAVGLLVHRLVFFLNFFQSMETGLERWHRNDELPSLRAWQSCCS